MRLTAALRVRQWLAKLHPPIPQSPRESQQLLRILESSFQKHLDEVHPPPSARQSSSKPNLDIPLPAEESSSKATYHFLNSLLSNPLLARSIDNGNNNAPYTRNAVNFFVKASNEGNITTPLLRHCAKEYLHGCQNGEKVSEEDQFAPKLTSWIQTTSLPMREAFFASAEVLELVIDVAASDQREDIAWEWLRMVYERDFESTELIQSKSLQDSKWLSIEDLFVSQLMRQSIRRGDLNDAAQQFVEACRYRSASNRAAARLEDATETLPYSPLSQSWKRLMAAIVAARGRHSISEHLFSQSLSYGLPWSPIPHFSVPVIMVYHPKSPSALLLTQHLQDKDLAHQFLDPQKGARKKFRRVMLNMLLDGAHISLDQGQRKQAQFLLEFARTHYQEMLLTIPKNEAESLDIQIHNAQVELNTHSVNFSWT